jgi:hypothetical protein
MDYQLGFRILEEVLTHCLPAVQCGDAAGLHMTGPDGKRYQVAELIKEDMEGPQFQINVIFQTYSSIQSAASTGDW